MRSGEDYDSTMLKYIVPIVLVTAACAANASFCSRTNQYRNGIVNTTKAATVAAGTGVGVTGAAAAVGVTAVAHSSGAMILTGSAGYIAGTLGVAAGTVAAAPLLVGGGLAVAGLAGGAMLFCRHKTDE